MLQYGKKKRLKLDLIPVTHFRWHFQAIKTYPPGCVNVWMINRRDEFHFRRFKWISVKKFKQVIGSTSKLGKK